MFLKLTELTVLSLIELKLSEAQVGWHTPLVPALRQQRQADLGVPGQPSLQREFQNSWSYTEKPHFEGQGWGDNKKENLRGVSAPAV